ncbi:MAG: hypothetical protein IKZ58_03260 [Selenomonadaceae bacterium]|nr:hypothetical protein [Selenomonadaceae bacterium]
MKNAFKFVYCILLIIIFYLHSKILHWLLPEKLNKKFGDFLTSEVKQITDWIMPLEPSDDESTKLVPFNQIRR